MNAPKVVKTIDTTTRQTTTRQTTTRPTTTRSTAAQPPVVSRRRLLGRAGVLAAAAAVTGTGVLGWRAAEQGVFAAGSGPAYNAWHDFGGSGRRPIGMVQAAVLAASAHNTQPWRFRLASGRIDLFAVPERTTATVDQLQREMYVSLGCALENLALAAAAAGSSPSVRLLPDPADRVLAASVQLNVGEAVTSALFRAIPHRHTNRGPYEKNRAVPAGALAAMTTLATEPDTALVWWTGGEEKRTFAELTVRATEAIVADTEQAIDDYRWWRGTRSALQEHKDGITIDSSGLPPLVRALGKILPDQDRVQYGASWIGSTRDTHVATAASFGCVVVRDADDLTQRINAGRVWQRLHLWVTANGLAVQPLNQVLERADRERATGIPPEFGSAVNALLPERGWQPVMPFRIGYPTVQPVPAPRRSAAEVTSQA